MDDVPVDDESPIDEWISIGFHRGVLTGVVWALMSMAILTAVWWMLE